MQTNTVLALFQNKLVKTLTVKVVLIKKSVHQELLNLKLLPKDSFLP